MRCLFEAALVATALTVVEAKASIFDYEVKLTLEEQEDLYKKITGPHCEENALTDPLCVHVKEAREERAAREEAGWKAPEFKRV